MVQQIINPNSTAENDGLGDTPFAGMAKANANFTELYQAKSDLETAVAGKAPIANPTFTGTVGGVTKSMVGLGNVDNTSDANKPVSAAQAIAIAGGDGLRLKASDLYEDFVVTGLATPVPVNSLIGAMDVGVAYVSGTRTERVAASIFTYQFSSDTYVDIDTAGTVYRTAVANGGAEPALEAGRLRLEKVVTDSTKIVSVTQLAPVLADVTLQTALDNKIVSAATAAGFPATGDAKSLYVALDTGVTYQWVTDQYVARTVVPYAPAGAGIGLRGPSGGLLRGALTGGEWFTIPSIFRVRLTGTGTVTLDSKDSLGNITTSVASYTVSGATDQIEFPFAGNNAVAIRAALTGDATCEVI